MTITIQENLLSADVLADPYAYFRGLREASPVHWNKRHRAWIVTRHDDVVAAFRDEALQPREETRRADEFVDRFLQYLRPPSHASVRRRSVRALSARAVEPFRETIGAIVDEVLAPLAGRVDFVADIATPLPDTILAEVLGIPRGEREDFLRWTADVGGVVFGDQRHPERRATAAAAAKAFEERFLPHVQPERPAALITALGAPGDDALSVDELISTCMILVYAGHSTTIGFLSSALLALLTHPEQLDLARTAFDERAVEELLRYEAPSGVVGRTASSATAIAGTPIEQGQKVLLAVCAANRDPERFADPDRLDLTREPRGQLSYGYGIHRCAGAPLASLVTEVFVPRFLARFPHVRLATDELDWTGSVWNRSLRTLALDLD